MVTSMLCPPSINRVVDSLGAANDWTDSLKVFCFKWNFKTSVGRQFCVNLWIDQLIQVLALPMIDLIDGKSARRISDCLKMIVCDFYGRRYFISTMNRLTNLIYYIIPWHWCNTLERPKLPKVNLQSFQRSTCWWWSSHWSTYFKCSAGATNQDVLSRMIE